MTGRFILGRKDILPICIKAGALSDNVPRRNLWISPCHAMYFESVHREGVLIEAKDLVNGTSIVQAERPKAVEYYHVELDSHDVIVAEGAFLRRSSTMTAAACFTTRMNFAGIYARSTLLLRRVTFAPRVDEGYELEAIRGRIAQRARLRSKPKRELERSPRLCRSCHATGPRVGAKFDHPEAPVCLDILAGGTLVGRALANRYREDLKRAGLGSGWHGFAIQLPSGLASAPNIIEVRRSLDQAALPLSSQATRFGEPDAA